jgi:N-carbamoylputrescine amidase
MNQKHEEKSHVVRVGLVQMACGAKKGPNVEKALQLIGEAAAKGAQVVCLQELFAGHYPCQSEDHARFADAEPIPGPTSDLLASAAAKHGVCLIGSLFERRAAGLFHNTAVVYDADGRIAGTYRKMHIPDDPLYYEKFYFTPGDARSESAPGGFASFPTRFANVGTCVCWDQWFPEAARATALHGAQILFYPTAIGWLPGEKDQYGASQHSAWETMMRSHAIANGVFVAAVNRVGKEGSLEFWGASFVADPYGNILARASHDCEEILLADCPLELIETARTHWPFLRDRRVDAYSDLLTRWAGS